MIWQLLFSVLLGFLIGLEREIHGKSVGIKTVSLITLGSTLFVTMSPMIMDGDNSRIIAQVVSGVGFICAGVLIKGDNHISGLTTSSILWVSAAIGCLVGCGMFLEAGLGTLLILIITWVFPYFKKR
jgi:putative Mg2+ transporter-C (MgtC) family protein